MSKQVFASDVLDKIQRVHDFKMTLTGRAVVNEGVDLTKFLEGQSYVIEPTNKEGCVLQLSIEDITEAGDVAVILPTEKLVKKVHAGKPIAKKAHQKHHMSAEAREKIAASQRKRWKAVRDAKAGKAVTKKKRGKNKVKKVDAASLPTPTAQVSDRPAM
jgi:hypothetical protein